MLIASSSSWAWLLMAAGNAAASASDTPSVWHWRNHGPAKPVSPVGRNIAINVPPDTDIWRPAANRNNFTAPFLYTTLAAEKFRSVQVTVAGPWKTLFDQGGLVVSFPAHDVNTTRFIKAGIEFNDGAAELGIVGTDMLSDWSLSPIPGPQPGHGHASIQIQRNGTDALVFASQGPAEKKRLLRQMTWAFDENDEQGLAKMIEVGIYGAKPTRESEPGHEHDGILVSFSGFALHTVDGPAY